MSAPADGASEESLSQTATVAVNDDPTEWTVDSNVFGKFTEMNAREGYPGIYSAYLANGSFEEWYAWPKRPPTEWRPWWRRSEVLFTDVESEHGVAFPWEPEKAPDARVSYEHAVGGVHGRAEDHRERTDVHGNTYREPEPRYQRVNVWEGRAGVRQRLALPDQRTADYDLSISVRGSGVEECRARLVDPDGTVLAEATVPVTESWIRREASFQLDASSTERYRESVFGELSLTLTVEGRGHVDFDRAQLRAGDAVAGRFNPTTVENVREYGIPSIRWPGGNFTSQYHWEDGVGPVADRPVRSELHWGGLEPNFLGTNEFLEFCEIAGVEPYLNVGFSEEITPSEAARWVEYVNGDPYETEMGALRAEHGHEEPWGVDVFQVGNEVWGTFQIGHTDPTDYGERFRRYHKAIKSVDPDITVFAVGLDPGMETWGGASWNERLFEAAGDVIEGIDIHRYVHGAMDGRDVDEYEYNQQLALFPTQFEMQIERIRDTAAEYGIEDLDITVGEWNMGANGLEEGRRANYGTMAHASFCAGMYNAFIRQGDAVAYGHQRDNAFKFRPFRSDLRPPWTANNAVLRLYTEPFREETSWHGLPVDVTAPTGRIDQQGENIEASPDVPFVDRAAIRSADGRTAHVFLTNRNLRESIETTVDLPGDPDEATVVAIEAADPLDETTEWDGTTSYARDRRSARTNDGTVVCDLSPGSVTRVSVDL